MSFINRIKFKRTSASKMLSGFCLIHFKMKTESLKLKAILFVKTVNRIKTKQT